MAEFRAGGTSLGDALRGVMANAERRNPEMVASARLTSAWNTAASEVQLKHTDAVYVVPDKGGREVVVFVDSNILATDLNCQCELLRLKVNIAMRDILEKAGQSLPADDPEFVKKLSFVASTKSYRGKRPDDVPVEQQLLDGGMHVEADPIPLSAEEEAAIEAQVSVIENPALRSAASRAMRAAMELEKGVEASSR